jgi:leucyl aminopeptidase
MNAFSSSSIRNRYYQIDSRLRCLCDARVGVQPSLVAADVAGKRLLHVPVGKLDRDYDDVRRLFDATRNIAQTLLDSGVRKPLLEINLFGLTDGQTAQLKNAIEAAYLGLCQGLWQPLEARQWKATDKSIHKD